ncbi:hypothetical protein, partial [Nostoc sp.]|uniref:hypothetical protein n=1 Tax=Nostoc sp. TaxID=1180 RepID=UPI002FFB8A50
MGSGEWGVGGDERGQGRIYFPSPLSLLYPQCPVPRAPCPMPNAQCPMPNAQCPMPNAQCPMPNAQCPMP